MMLRYKRCRAIDCEHRGRWMPPCIPAAVELPDVWQQWQPRARSRMPRVLLALTCLVVALVIRELAR